MNKLQLAEIHHTAVRILNELGIRTLHARIRARLAGLGCRITDAAIHIPPEVVERTVASIPHGFRLYGRSDRRGVLVDAFAPSLCTNTGILPNIYDFESGLIRRSLLADVETSTRMLDALSEVDVVYISLVDATEAPPHLVTLTDLVASLANTTKPLIGPGVTSGPEARAVVAIALALRDGDRGELAARPPCAPFVGMISPLYLPEGVGDALIELAHSGLPLMALTNPIMGVTAPYTIAGTVALGHAEMLALAVIAHAFRPGLPIVSFNTPSVADMRTMAATTGGPEAGLMRAAAVEVARHLGIPSIAHGHTSSARLDIQAADEKALNSLLIAQARPSLLGGLGGLANVTLTSYETLVLDNERFGALRRVLRDVAVDEEHLAFDVVCDMARGQGAIGHSHTLHHLRSGEVWQPKLAQRQGLVNGRPEPASMLERARSETRSIMDNHKVEPLADSVKGEINAIFQAYDREITAAARA